MSIEAIDLIRERCKRFAIDCDWRDGWLGLAVNAKRAAQLKQWQERMATVYGIRRSGSRPRTSAAGSTARASTAACQIRARAICIR